MEYILGSIITLITIVVINRMVRDSVQKNDSNFQITQSYLFKLLSEYNDKLVSPSLPDTQSFKHVKNQYIRIMIVEDKAYWIKNNQLYMADFNGDDIDNSSTREVDTMSMSTVELEQTMFIVEKLSEDKEK